jgi:hypothetical protein
MCLTFVEVPISDEGLQVLAEFNELDMLAFTNMSITDEGIQNLQLQDKVTLTILGLQGTQVSDIVMPQVGKLSKLKRLALGQTKVTSRGLQYLEPLKQLNTISLSGTDVDDAGLSHLSRLPTLYWLALSDTRTSDDGLRHLGSIRSLDMLQLSNTKVTDAGLKHLLNLKKLRTLGLDGTAITDEGLKSILLMEGLEQLYIQKTRVTGKGLEVLLQHPSLKRVATDAIPWEEQNKFWSTLPSWKKAAAEAEALRKAGEEARQKGFVPTRTVALRTFTFGQFDENDNLRETDLIPYAVGNEFGYELAVHTPRGKVHVKEVLELPGPVPWPETQQAGIEGMKVLSTKVLNGRKTHVLEYELHCQPDNWISYGQGYEILQGHPKGQHRLTIYINDDLAEEVTFEVE